MKTRLIIIIAIWVGFTGTLLAQGGTTTTVTTSTTTTSQQPKLIKKTFPHFTVSPYGGAIFPLPKVLNQNFKPGGNFGMDLGVRINKEVGLFAKFGYDFMASKINGAPIGSYFEFSGGPRYYFMNPKLKSQLFFEAGLGAYYFRQNSYNDPSGVNGGVINQIVNTKPGLSGGAGASLYLSDAVDILIKSDYHVVFTPNGTSSFMTVGAGFDFSFK